MISGLEIRRIYTEWRTRLQRVQAILKPPTWTEADWRQFGRSLVGLLRRHGATWVAEPKTYWDLRWRLVDGGELICQAELIPDEKISVVVAQMGGFVHEVESYTWFWAEFNPQGEFIRDPYWVEGTWKDALTTLLMPYQYRAGYYLSGSTPTPPSLMLGHSSSTNNDQPAAHAEPSAAGFNAASFQTTAAEDENTF